MSRHRRHHRHHHFDPRHQRGPAVTYGMAGYGWGFGTAQSGIHECLSGQQFSTDACPAAMADAGATTGSTDTGGTTSGGDAGAAP